MPPGPSVFSSCTPPRFRKKLALIGPDPESWAWLDSCLKAFSVAYGGSVHGTHPYPPAPAASPLGLTQLACSAVLPNPTRRRHRAVARSSRLPGHVTY